MSYSEYRITLDVRKTVSSVQLTAKKGDEGRKIYITLTDAGSPCQIHDGSYAVFSGVKPDGTLLYNKTTIEDNTIIYVMTRQTTAVDGVVACEVKLFDSMSNLLTSPKLTILVDDVVVPDEEIASMSEVTALAELVADANATIVLGNETIAAAKEATAAAKSAAQSANDAYNNATQAAEIASTAASNASSQAGSAEKATSNANTATANANNAASDARAATEETNAARENIQQAATEAIETIREIVDDGTDAPPIVCESFGEMISVSDCAERLLQNLRIFGKTVQNGTPSPEAPVPLESLGAGGSVGVAVTGKNLYSRDDSKTVNAYATMELPVPLPPGTYTVSALVSSTDTDNSTSFANFMHHNGSSYVVAGSAKLQRDVYNSATVTIATTCEAIRFHAGTNIGNSTGDTATWSDIMVEAGAAATAFEPYNGQTVTASTPNGLPGVPVTSGGNYTDANGQQWVCDEIDFARGVYIHRVGGGKLAEVTNWRGATNIGTHVRIFGTAHSDWYKNTRSYSYNKSKGLYSHGKYAERYDEDTVHAYIAGSYVYVFVPPEIASTAEELTAWITAQENAGTPPEIMVALDAEYVVETALSAEDLAAYAALHSNNPDTSAWNDAVAHMALSYVADTKTYIDNKFTELQNAIVATGANV